MTVLGVPLISLLYGGKFDGMVTVPMLAAAAVQIVLAALIMVVMLRATGNARLTFVGQIPPTAIMLTAGLLLVESHGVLGAFVANDLSSAGMLAALLLALSPGRRFHGIKHVKLSYLFITGPYTPDAAFLAQPTSDCDGQWISVRFKLPEGVW